VPACGDVMWVVHFVLVIAKVVRLAAMRLANRLAYCKPHYRDCGLSGSPCPARSEGHKRQRAAKFGSLGINLNDVPKDKSSSRSLTNSAAVARSRDDLPETFAAIGSASDKTNTQMTSPTKTINKQFAVQGLSKTLLLMLF